MEEIIKLIIQILVGIAALAVTYIMPKIRAWITEKIGAENMAKLDGYITEFVAAAEQMLKADDPTGEKRLQYVIDQLTKLGYTVTDEIRAAIESKVFEINLLTAENN